MGPAKTDTEPHSAVTAQGKSLFVLSRNFTAEPRIWTMALLLIAFPSFFIRIVLQLIVSCHLIASLSNSGTQSSPRSHYILAINAAQLRVVTWLF